METAAQRTDKLHPHPRGRKDRVGSKVKPSLAPRTCSDSFCFSSPAATGLRGRRYLGRLRRGGFPSPSSAVCSSSAVPAPVSPFGTESSLRRGGLRGKEPKNGGQEQTGGRLKVFFVQSKDCIGVMLMSKYVDLTVKFSSTAGLDDNACCCVQLFRSLRRKPTAQPPSLAAQCEILECSASKVKKIDPNHFKTGLPLND